MEKDVRSLIHFFSQHGETNRDKSRKISMLLDVLNVEVVEEVQDILDQGQVGVFALLASEIRAILSLRVEFSREKIYGLSIKD